MKKIYTLYFYLNDDMMVQEFDSFEEMQQFVNNYDVEVFKYTSGIKLHEETTITYESSISSKYE